jgi:hypothetical protein
MISIPDEHWLYLTPDEVDNPPMPFRMGKGPRRKEWEDKIRQAAQYAIRAATCAGEKVDEMDPDQFVHHVIVGLLGHYSDDGRGLAPGQDPVPVPPIFAEHTEVMDTTIGYMAAWACLALDSDVDIRQLEMSDIADAAHAALDPHFEEQLGATGE